MHGYGELQDEIVSYEAQMTREHCYGAVLAEPRRRRAWWLRLLARVLR